MCRSAVIALYGRTPRGGTAGHVASRRGLDRTDTARRPLGGPLGAAGSRAVARHGAGLDRGETRGSGGSGRTPLPCREADPALPRNARRAENRARGRCRTRHAAAAASDGSAKCVEGQCRSMSAGSWRLGQRGDGSPITTELPHARPALAGRGRIRLWFPPLRVAATAAARRRAISRVSVPASAWPLRRRRRLHVQGSDSAISGRPRLAKRSFSASARSAWTVVSASTASRLSWRRTSGAK